jgi:hypothetical protein
MGIAPVFPAVDRRPPPAVVVPLPLMLTRDSSVKDSYLQNSPKALMAAKITSCARIQSTKTLGKF